MSIDSLVAKKLAIVEGAILVLKDQITPNNTTYPKEIAKIVKDIDKETLQSTLPNHMRVERAVYDFVSQSSSVPIPWQGMKYSQDELKMALYKNIFENMNSTLVNATYGIPSKTLTNYKSSLVEYLHLDDKKSLRLPENEDSIKTYIDTKLELKHRGPEPTFRTENRDILATRMDEMKKSGVGLDRKAMSSFVRMHAEKTAKYMEEENNGVETNESKKLKGLKACGKFIGKYFLGNMDSLHSNNNDQINNENNSSENSSSLQKPLPFEKNIIKGSMVKASTISYKRAQASSPSRHEEMINMFLKHDQELITKGVFGVEGPLAENVFNLDEIGFDPHGRILGVYSLRNTAEKKEERAFILQSDEHAPFWVSVILTACANGDLLAPIIIHKGGSEGSMPGNFVMNLPNEYRVTATKSGYSDHDSFKIAGSVISKYLSDKIVGNDDGLSSQRNGSSILYLDGHDSHFDLETHQYFLQENVYCRFLKANDSINDQPLDNGINSVIRAAYNEAYTKWRITNVGEKITPAIFNKLFAEAFEKAKAEPKTVRKVTECFRKTGCWPLHNKYDDADMSSSKCAKAKLSEVFAANEVDQKKLKKMKMDCDSPQTKVIESHSTSLIGNIEYFTPFPHDPTVLGIKGVFLQDDEEDDDKEQQNKVHIAEKGTKEYAVLIDRSSLRAHHDSFVVPVQENAFARQQEKEAKKVKLDKANTKPQCLANPSTSKGLCMSQTVLAELTNKIDLRKEKLKQKDMNVEKRKSKEFEQYRHASGIFTEMHNKCTQQCATALNKIESIVGQYKLENLKAVFKYHVKKKEDPTPSRKNQFVPLIANKLFEDKRNGVNTYNPITTASSLTTCNNISNSHDNSGDDDDDDYDDSSVTSSDENEQN